MRCELCHTQGNVEKMPCGHGFHIECLRAHTRDWSIPCTKCHVSLARAYDDGTHWYIGIDTKHQMHCMFQISDESKVIRSEKCFSHWKRRNGRLLRRQMLPLKSNICVS